MQSNRGSCALSLTSEETRQAAQQNAAPVSARRTRRRGQQTYPTSGAAGATPARTRQSIQAFAVSFELTHLRATLGVLQPGVAPRSTAARAPLKQTPRSDCVISVAPHRTAADNCRVHGLQAVRTGEVGSAVNDGTSVGSRIPLLASPSFESRSEPPAESTTQQSGAGSRACLGGTHRRASAIISDAESQATDAELRRWGPLTPSDPVSLASAARPSSLQLHERGRWQCAWEVTATRQGMSLTSSRSRDLARTQASSLQEGSEFGAHVLLPGLQGHLALLCLLDWRELDVC